MVKRDTLIALAGVLWAVAGVNVVAVGFAAYTGIAAGLVLLAAMTLGSAAVFVLFFVRIFRPYSVKHMARIDSMRDAYMPAWRFMNRKGYIMIVVMMSLGVGLRLSGLVPQWFIAVFYTGLGTALAFTGVLFIVEWCRRNGGQKKEKC